MQENAPSIFLCYASEDFERVHALYALLKSLGLRPWFDKYDIKGGELWPKAIERAVKNADFFIAAFSKTSVKKTGFVQREYKFAMDTLADRPVGAIYLIPVRLDDCELPDLGTLGQRLSDIQWVDLFQKGPLTASDIEPILSAVESQSKWRRKNPELCEIENLYGRELDASIMETLRVRALPYTDDIIELRAIGDKAKLHAREEQAYKLYLSTPAGEIYSFGLNTCYLVASYLYRAILKDDYNVCRFKPFIYPVHQYLSGMIRTAPQVERQLIISTLKKWFTTKDIYQTSRDFAAFELGMSKAREAIEILFDAVDDPFELPLVKYYAGMAIGMIGKPATLDRLSRIFAKEKDEEIRKVLAHSIIYISRETSEE